MLDKAAAENQDPINRPYYRALQGMRVTLPVGIATGGGTTKFHDVFVEPGTDATRLFRKNDAAAESTPWSDAPAELGIAPDGGAGNPADPRRPWRSTTQVDLDLFDKVENVTGPLSFGFSYFKIVPQLAGAPAPTIVRGPINAAYPPAAPTPAENTLRVASFNVENLFPVGKENDQHAITQEEYDERVRTLVLAIRNFLKEPDVIAVQEVAVFPDGATPSPASPRRSATTRATSPPTTTAAASRRASWSRTARRRPTARDRRRGPARGPTRACATCTRASSSTAPRTRSSSRRATYLRPP